MRLKITGTMGITVAVSTRAGPTVSTKKFMKDGVSSPNTKMCLSPDDTKNGTKLRYKYKCMCWSSEANHKGARVGGREKPVMDDWPLTSHGLVKVGHRGQRVVLW